MKITLAGVFVGVFVGALAYELLQRNRPETVEKIRENVSDLVDKYMPSSDAQEENSDTEKAEAGAASA